MVKAGSAEDAESRDDDRELNRLSGERKVRESGPVPRESGNQEPGESGFPPRGRVASSLDGSNEHLELALAESTRTEANLNSLVRGLQNLTAGARAARDANAALSRELDTVRDLLDRSRAETTVLFHRVRLLEQSLASERRESTRERASFIAQEDAFLAELMRDHEREREDLKRRLAHALDRAAQAERQPETPPTALGAVKLRTLRIPMPSQELIEEADKLLPPRPSSRPPLKQKPDPSTRPLTGYRLGSDDVAEERIDADRITSRPPPASGG